MPNGRLSPLPTGLISGPVRCPHPKKWQESTSAPHCLPKANRALVHPRLPGLFPPSNPAFLQTGREYTAHQPANSDLPAVSTLPRRGRRGSPCKERSCRLCPVSPRRSRKSEGTQAPKATGRQLGVEPWCSGRSSGCLTTGGAQ